MQALAPPLLPVPPGRWCVCTERTIAPHGSAVYVHSMAEQPDPQVRKTVSLPASLWRQIEDYQFAKRVKRDAEAVRQLVLLGLKAAASDKPAVTPTMPEDVR